MIWGRKAWLVSTGSVGSSAVAPRGSFIIIEGGAYTIASVVRGADGQAEPTVAGEPQPSACHLGRYIPCGDEGVGELADWLSLYTVVVWNVGFARYDPVRDGLGQDYLCHHSLVALVIPILKAGEKQWPITKLPWKRACQASHQTIHRALQEMGWGLRLA